MLDPNRNQLAGLEAGLTGQVMFSNDQMNGHGSGESEKGDTKPKLLRFLSYAPNADAKKFDRGDDYKEIQQYQLPQDMNTMIDVEKVQEKLSVYKGQLPFPRLFFLGVLAGWWVGLAVILVVTIAGGIPIQTRTDWPCLTKLAAGFFFPVAIFLIIIFGGELFTGNAMSLLIGLFARRVTVLELLYNWSVVLVSNFVGCVFTVYMFGRLTNLFEAEPFLSYTKSVAVYKIHLKPEVAFLRAIPANALVCTSVLVGQQARTMTGKLVSALCDGVSSSNVPIPHLSDPCLGSWRTFPAFLLLLYIGLIVFLALQAGMWFPIMIFAISGFEHAIANMAFIPLGLMYDADADYKNWLYQNLILVILGNIVGGGMMIGGTAFYLFDWSRHRKAAVSAGLAAPTAAVPTEQVERHEAAPAGAHKA